MEKSRRSGFSRIEVLAVLGASGLLAGVVLPAAAQGGLFDVFVRARQNARAASCQSNLKQLSLGMLQYQMDYDEVGPRATIGGEAYGWAYAIQPYVQSMQLFQCPSEKHSAPEMQRSRVRGVPSADARQKGLTDYWLNSRVSGRATSDFAAPEQTIWTGDGDGGSAASTARYSIASLPPSWLKTAASPALRHPWLRDDAGAANYAYLDGHVKRVPPSGISNAPVAQAARAGAYATFSIR